MSLDVKQTMKAKIENRGGGRGLTLHKAQRATSKTQDNRPYYTSTVSPVQILWSALRVKVKHAHNKPANPLADSKDEWFQSSNKSPEGSDISVMFSGIEVRHGLPSIASHWPRPEYG